MTNEIYAMKSVLKDLLIKTDQVQGIRGKSIELAISDNFNKIKLSKNYYTSSRKRDLGEV